MSKFENYKNFKQDILHQIKHKTVYEFIYKDQIKSLLNKL